MDTTNNTNKTNVKKVRGHRRKHVPPLRRIGLYLTEDQVKQLRKWGRGDVSAGLRWLVDSASALILRKSELDRLVPPHSSE